MPKSQPPEDNSHLPAEIGYGESFEWWYTTTGGKKRKAKILPEFWSDLKQEPGHNYKLELGQPNWATPTQMRRAPTEGRQDPDLPNKVWGTLRCSCKQFETMVRLSTRNKSFKHGILSRANGHLEKLLNPIHVFSATSKTNIVYDAYVGTAEHCNEMSSTRFKYATVMGFILTSKGVVKRICAQPAIADNLRSVQKEGMKYESRGWKVEWKDSKLAAPKIETQVSAILIAADQAESLSDLYRVKEQIRSYLDLHDLMKSKLEQVERKMVEI